MTVWLALVVRSVATLAVTLGMVACLQRRSAALRHWVLTAGIFGAAVVVPCSLAFQVFDISLASPWTLPGEAVGGPVSVAVATTAQAAPGASVWGGVSPIVVLWLVGFVAVGMALLVSVVRLRGIVARATPIVDRRWAHAVSEVSAAYALPRPVTVLETASPDLLATWGFLRPCVLVPPHARDWSADRIHVVLCHELAHVRRRDWAIHMCAEFLRAALWFNPLIWIACRRLRREGEQACDDEVLARGVEAREYAAQLLALARLCRRPDAWLPATPMATASTLERRIAAMLNSRLDRRAPTRRAFAVTSALVLAATLSAAAFGAGQSGPATLTGAVYDSTGGVLPGVAVTFTDASGTASHAMTNAAGRFQFVNVPPGTYTMEATLQGFRTLRTEFELQKAPDWDRAITLQVGVVSESINVTASRMPAQAPDEPVAAKPLRVGGNIRVPLKVVDVRPVYPPAMRAAGREGVVPIEAIIGNDGTVSSVRVLSAQVHPDFAIAAVDAVRQWRFRPTLLNGAPVEVVMTVSVTFKLSE